MTLRSGDWHTINSENDNEVLQKDISYLDEWANNNKMKFHTGKCKVLSVAQKPPPVLGILPDIQYFYHLGENLLEYSDNERDLGVDMNPKLNWNEQCNREYIQKQTKCLA